MVVATRRLLRLSQHETYSYKAKRCILGHIWPAVIHLLTPKFDAFILDLKSVSNESLVKFGQQIPKISC